ncbi:maleylpyruvate isomerase N-terminal domain-containing protein [Streptomyces sp. NPDC006446]|uniref:maleylpyruvate isomerase N-terminal domain-containing protein n=1 Tax=Streptomyces sp. NPDC006446 TaxID=3154301 RepID=UPI0033B5E34B
MEGSPDYAKPTEVLRNAYEAFAAVVTRLDDQESWLPTGCTGWAVRDLVFHCLADAQRGLVGLHTPSSGPADRNTVTYWQGWKPGTAGAANGRRWAQDGRECSSNSINCASCSWRPRQPP